MLDGKEAKDASTGSERKEASIDEMKKVFHDKMVESGGQHTSLWTIMKETLGMADSKKSKATGTLVDTEHEALFAIKDKVQEAKEKDGAKKHPHGGMWDFEWTPLQEFSATIDDLLLAFCRWTRKDNDDDGDGNMKQSMNISKAFQCLELYAQWMYDARSDLEEPLTVDYIKGAAKAFDIKPTHDASGRLLWWFDLLNTDLKAIKDKTVGVSESMRYFVWSTHIVLLDKQAQANGLLFIEDMHGILLILDSHGCISWRSWCKT